MREYATVQWAMCIGLVPLLLGLFQQVSLVSPIANAFAIPLVSLIVVPLALLGAVLPSEVPLWLAHIAMDITMIPLEYLSALPDAVWTQHAPPAWSIVFGMLGVLWILAPKGFPARWLGFLLMLPMFLNQPEPPAKDSLRLIKFLHPDSRSFASAKAHDNNQSCVLRVSIGKQHILLAGDIEKRSEQRLLSEHDEQLSSNLLVVPHHGSSSSSDVDFIASVLPDYAVFTVGYRNQFGHPKQEIRQRYLDSGATLLRSDKDGAILAEMNSDTLTLERYRQTHHRYWTHTPQNN
jgi:hypothetical protein